MAEKKSERREAMFYTQKNGYDIIAEKERLQLRPFADGYKEFLDRSRTERETVRSAIKLAESRGFVPYTRGMELKPGAKVYLGNRGKSVMLAVIGKRPLSEGAVIAAAHIDSPRLDLKPLPLYEDSELAFLKTHYYGGIKKYQWMTIPLELHGAAALKNGTVVDFVIGGDREDPIFTITDLLPHLANDQFEKKLGKAFSGESLNILIGSALDKEEGDDRVKLAVLDILHEKYGITEEDFISAEIEAVPSFETRDIGFDRSLIGGYGHDDRVCAYACLQALLDIKKPAKTCVAVLTDKEEIGSEGASGMRSDAFDGFMSGLCETQGVSLYECFGNSFCLSADVSNGFDPNYPEVSEKRNNAKINYGAAVLKYSGSRGKYSANDASAEDLAKLRRIFSDNEVIWQMAELGKVDQGGGGTVAVYMARRNINTVDIGVPVLSMHAPFEVVSKLDLYMTYKAVRSVFGEKA